MTPDQETAIWESLLDADMNKRYWGYMARRYQKREQVATIFLAATSSTTVATWAVWKSIEWVWQTLSVVAAIISVALPILNYPRQIEPMVELTTKWGVIQLSYKNLWLSLGLMPDTEALEEFKKIRGQESELISTEARLPYDKRLLRKCQDEVIASRTSLT